MMLLGVAARYVVGSADDPFCTWPEVVSESHSTATESAMSCDSIEERSDAPRDLAH